MSIPGSATPLLLATTAAEAAAAYQVDRSLRFNSADSAYLSRTPSSAGNRRTWTWSGWVKKNNLSGYQHLIDANDGSNYFDVQFYPDGRLGIYSTIGGQNYVETVRLFRDFSAWYHLVIVLDTTQSTSTDRIKLYVNNVRETNFNRSVFPGQNDELMFNAAVEHEIGGRNNNEFLNGYLAEVHFIDGQALAPTDFGEYDSNNNWNPKEFTGTYSSGVDYLADLTINGTLYTDGDDPANAFDGSTSTQVQLNNNAQNQTITFAPAGGISYTSSVEVYIRPSGNTAVTRYSVNGGSDQSLSGTNYWQTILSGSGTFNSFVMKQMAQSNSVGFAAIRVDGTILVQGTGFNSFYLPFSDNSSNAALGYDQKETVTLNPDGGMAVVAYTGNGSTQDIKIGFQPDFVWFKQRSGGSFNGARSHELVDSVRGLGKALESASSNTEFTSNNGLTAYNSDGFTIGSEGRVNENNASHVAWAWKAGGAASLNENGSIDSQVSVSTDYGFSIVSYTGNGTNGATIGHGLGATPAWVIVKNRDASRSWNVYHQSYNTSTDTALVLDDTGATAGDKWRRDLFSSTVFGVRNVNQLNNNNEKYIAYCWSEVSGFSKFGSYTGNGSTTGPVVTTGFKPRFVLIKRTDSAASWQIKDTERTGSVPPTIYANLNNAESTDSSLAFDFLDNGFQPKTSTDSGTNANGGTYIYAAFADRPGNNFDVNNLVAASGNTVSASSVSLTAPSGGFLSGRDSKTYVIDGDTSSYLLANNSNDNYSVNFSPGITVNSSVEIYGLTSGQSASTNLSSATSYTSGQYTEIYSGSGTLTQITMVASGNRPALAAIKVDGVLLIGTNDESSIDSLLDTPTNYDADSGNNGGNYCTLNPLDKNTSATLSDGNLEFYNTATSHYLVRSTFGITSGKWYFEATIPSDATSAANFCAGVCTSAHPLNNYVGAQTTGWGLLGNGNTQHGPGSSYTSSLAKGDVIGVAFDADNGKIWWSINGSYPSSGDPGSGANAAYSNLTVGDGPYFPAVSAYQSAAVCNFGQRPFAYTPPSGFKSLCTTNLTDPTIADGSTAMNVVTYAGNGTTQTLSGLNFSPDFVWIKERTDEVSHYLSNTIAGVNKNLQSNSTNTEATNHPYGYVSAATSDGFTVTAGSSDDFYTNGSTETYAAWLWDAGTSTVSNTDGSITSSVRANASAGFSIVSYTGSATTGTTVGHGLNAAPEFIIIKNRDQTYDWYVFGDAIDSTFDERLTLNSTATKTSSTSAMDATAPTSSVFTVGNNSGTNGNGDDIIAYCFTPVKGYSAFGSYTGNGSTDGTFVYTGFRPKFLLVKGNATIDWIIEDSSRDTFNQMNKRLYPNDGVAESTSSNGNMDFLSNGFKPRTTHLSLNSSGTTYYYVAFAEHPFKTARAR